MSILVREKEVEDFFFKAMLKGWGSEKPKKIKIPRMPGYKGIKFTEGDLYLLDIYCVVPHSNRSAGTTTIWYENTPIWVMNYMGWYNESAIPFLKEALMTAYEQKRFYGGRGYYLENDDFIYQNRVDASEKKFSIFKGKESITTKAGRDHSAGSHEYWGMSLVDFQP